MPHVHVAGLPGPPSEGSGKAFLERYIHVKLNLKVDLSRKEITTEGTAHANI